MESPATGHRAVGHCAIGHCAVGHCAIGHEELLVHNWRVTQLTRLGIPGSLAETYADRIDWHQVAGLVHRGCPPRLALRIVC
jgi:hypothetical protein